MSKEGNKKKQVAPQDVLDYLETAKAQGPAFESEQEVEDAVKAVTRQVDPRDLSPEEHSAFSTEDENGNTKRPVVDTPLPQEFKKVTPVDAVDFMLHTDDLGDVEVTEEEKMLYMKTLLNDVPYELSINILDDLDIKVRARTVEADELVFSALQDDFTDGKVIGVESSYFFLQKYLMAAQLLFIGDSKVELELPEAADWEEKKRLIREHCDKHYKSLPLPKWKMLVKAVMLFDAKQKICNDRLLDKSFWKGVSTS